MEKKSVDFIKEKDTQDLFNYIFEQAFGEPISFESVPTLEDMNANSWGFNGNDIYIKTKDGGGIKLSGASFS